VVTCEIKLFRNNFEIILVFHFTGSLQVTFPAVITRRVCGAMSGSPEKSVRAFSDFVGPTPGDFHH